MNSLPFPGSERTWILPPIISTSPLVMARPRPEPPYFLVVELSTWTNVLNIAFCFSGGIPIPVSFTEMLRVRRPSLASSGWEFSSFARTRISPFSVNFAALPRIFNSTCLMRVGSPRKVLGVFAWKSQYSSMSFPLSRGLTILNAFSTRYSRSKSISSNSICLASILEISRISLIRVARTSPLSWIVLT